MTELFKPAGLRKLGRLQYFQTPEGHTVVVLPTCSVPVEHLIAENWAPGLFRDDYGHFRGISYITELVDGTQLPRNQQLFVKHPERVFNAEKGKLWWGGNRSYQEFISIKNNRVVEQQAKWEARVLIGLLTGGNNAEQPQAIILYKNGQRAVVTKYGTVGSSKAGYDAMIESARMQGAKPEDIGGHNAYIDRETGLLGIIDVNRWGWKKPKNPAEKLPEYDSDKYRARLIAELDKLRK